jgi:hypothetical protein
MIELEKLMELKTPSDAVARRCLSVADHHRIYELSR